MEYLGHWTPVGIERYSSVQPVPPVGTCMTFPWYIEIPVLSVDPYPTPGVEDLALTQSHILIVIVKLWQLWGRGSIGLL